MKKNNKRDQKRPPKYQPRNKIVTTTDPGERTTFYEQTDADAPLGKYQLAAGAIQHPRTRLWQMWVSTNGLDLNYLCAHRDKTKAEEAVEAFKRFASTGDIYDPEKVTVLYEQFIKAGDAEPEPLPDATVKQIGREILHMVINMKEPGK